MKSIAGKSIRLSTMVFVATIVCTSGTLGSTPKRTSKTSSMRMVVTKKKSLPKPVSIGIGWGDGKTVFVPLQINGADYDEVDVESNSAIGYHQTRLNGIDTFVLRIPIDQLVMPQTVTILSLRHGNRVTFVLRLNQPNMYTIVRVQSQGKTLKRPGRCPLNSGRPEERKSGFMDVAYVPPPTGTYWTFTEDFRLVAIPKPRKTTVR